MQFCFVNAAKTIIFRQQVPYNGKKIKSVCQGSGLINKRIYFRIMYLNI
jgi:hypothetical protein